MATKTLKFISVIATLFLAVAVAILLFRGALFSWHPAVIVLQGLSLALMAWARATLGNRSFHIAATPTPGGLVTHGPYRFVRNPIYLAAGLFVGAGVAAHPELANLLLGSFVLAMFAIRIACEEICLTREFPDYPAYAKRTARIIPFVL